MCQKFQQIKSILFTIIIIFYLKMSDSRNDIRGDSIKYTKRLSNQEDLRLEVFFCQLESLLDTHEPFTQTFDRRLVSPAFRGARLLTSMQHMAHFCKIRRRNTRYQNKYREKGDMRLSCIVTAWKEERLRSSTGRRPGAFWYFRYIARQNIYCRRSLIKIYYTFINRMNKFLSRDLVSKLLFDKDSSTDLLFSAGVFILIDIRSVQFP